MNQIVRPGAIHLVDIVVHPGFKALEAIGTLKVFDYANSHLAARGNGQGYRVSIAAAETGMVASDTIMSLHATKKVDPLRLPGSAIVLSGGIDRALAMVEADFGSDLALEIARDLVVYLKRPGGQSQLSVHLSNRVSGRPKVRDLQDWILAHLADDLSTPMLAQRLAMSERNLNRVFQREVASTPAEFIEKARFELARRLLENSRSPFKLVAARTGFGTEERMRRVFQRRLGITPRDYCQRLAGPVRAQASTA